MRKNQAAPLGGLCRLALGSRVPASCALLRVSGLSRAMRKGGAVWITAPGKRRAYFFFFAAFFFAAFFAFFAIWPPEGPGSA